MSRKCQEKKCQEKSRKVTTEKTSCIDIKLIIIIFFKKIMKNVKIRARDNVTVTNTN